MLRILLLVLPLFGGNQLLSQPSNFDLRGGMGTYFAGTLDMRGLMLENELNYTLGPKLATSVQVGIGRSNYGVGEMSSFVQTNLTLFLSTFGNYRRNDFRLGAGVGYLNVKDVFLSRLETRNGVVVNTEYTFRQRNDVGVNLVLENTYALSERFLLGVKLFGQGYGGDGNSGLLLKFGVRL